jgi:hypothetical protein
MSERDPEIDALWRAQSRDEPPAALDNAILAAAHRAVHAQPASTTARARSPWPAWAGFAAAASIGAIANGVWQLQAHDGDETKVVASDVPPSAAAPRASARRDTAPGAPRSDDGRAPSHDALAVSKALDEAQRRVLSAPGLPPAEVDRQALAAATPRPADERQRAAATVAQNAPAATPPPAMPAAAPQPAAPTAAPRTNVAADAASKPSPFPGAGAGAPRPNPLHALRGEGAPVTASQSSGLAEPRTDKSRAAPAVVPAAPRPERMGEGASAAAPAAKPSTARAVTQASAKTTGDYIAAIRRALAEHRDADARAELTQMRAEFEFADAALPDDLHTWAKGVPRVAR